MEEWDFHASYQWTFFPEVVKEMLSQWLSSRVKGPSNIDIGSGWYESVPGSIALDYSAVSLAKNPSANKILFDLDTLDTGKTIPLPDRSLETATMVSTWQYITRPDLVLKELQRVLIPGGKVYILNNDGAGLSKYIRQSAHGEFIAEYINALGYDTHLIQLPLYKNPTNYWWAVEVTMPSSQLEFFPKKVEPSARVDKILSQGYDMFDSRWPENQDEYREAQSQVVKLYAESELLRTRYLHTLLQSYPITLNSVEIVEQAQQEANELSAQRGHPVLLWSTGLPVEVEMYEPCDSKRFELMVYQEPTRKHSGFSYSGDKACGVHEGSMLPVHLKMMEDGVAIEELTDPTRSGVIGTSTFKDIVTFTQQHALNDFTRQKQALACKFLEEYKAHLQSDFETEVYTKFIQWLEKTQREIRAEKFYFLFVAVKQVRKIERLIDRKHKIEKEALPTMGKGKLTPLDTAMLEELREMFVARATLR